MKNFLVAVFILIGISSGAQVPTIQQNLGTPKTMVHVPWMTPDSAIVLKDTVHSAPDGSIGWKNHKFYVKDTTWKEVSGGGVGTIGSGTTYQTVYYASNGTVITAKSDIEEEFTGSTSMTITLSHTPITGLAETYWLNGIKIKSSNIIRTGTSVTLSGFTRESSDVITAKYSY